MPRDDPRPEPPTPAPGTLLGAPAATRPRPVVPDDVAADHARDARESAQAELADRLGEAGGLPDPPAERDWAPYGPAPLRQVRRLFVAKFNPAESDPVEGRFLESDPASSDQLWDPHGPPECWVSDEPGHTRHQPAHEAVTPGDLVLVQRSQPSLGGRPVVDPADPLRGRRHLLGVWCVVRVHRRQSPAAPARPVTEVWHAPLVRFDDPVDVQMVRRRHAELRDVAAFTTPNAAVVQATPVEAAALVAACSLPSYVLTDPDPVAIARRLADVRTGMRPGDLRYARDARARYELVRDVEAAAVRRVERELVAAGWSVVSREREPRWGGDLDCRRRLPGRQAEARAVEVKGKAGDGWRDVVLQRSQHERARRSAAAGDGQWWLAIQQRALDPTPPALVELPAGWVTRHWPAGQVR